MPIPPIGSPTAVTPVGVAAPGSASSKTFGAALRARGSPTPEPSRARQVACAALDQIDRARQRLDQALAAARRGRTFTAQELLVLQADAYRFSQHVEIASKVVEQTAQALKQTVNAQV